MNAAIDPAVHAEIKEGWADLRQALRDHPDQDYVDKLLIALAIGAADKMRGLKEERVLKEKYGRTIPFSEDRSRRLGDYWATRLVTDWEKE